MQQQPDRVERSHRDHSRIVPRDRRRISAQEDPSVLPSQRRRGSGGQVHQDVKKGYDAYGVDPKVMTEEVKSIYSEYRLAWRVS